MPTMRGIREKQTQRLAGAASALVPYASIFIAVVAVWAAGVLTPIDYLMMDVRFRLLDREPSQSLVVVEIDSRSLREEAQWPWPRDRYATAVKNLQDAGAYLIGFDVDFSALSDAEGDAAFAEALARRPGDVVLPVFSQWSPSDVGGAVVTAPHSFFLQDAVIANVNLATERSGILRHGLRGVMEGDAFRGSMAAVLAGHTGIGQDGFYIDYSIDPAAIDRISFHDVLVNDFPKELVDGKNILIGATALELGDEFAVPIRGVLPGALLHALSYESLAQGRAINRLHFCIPLLMALGVILWFVGRCRRWTWSGFIVRNLALLGVLAVAPLALQAAAPISLDVGHMLAAQLFCVVYILGDKINHYTKQILKQRAAMAHFQTLARLVIRDSADGVIVAHETGVIELCSPRAQELLGIYEPVAPGDHIHGHVSGFPLHAPDPGKSLTTEPDALLADEPTSLEYIAPDAPDRTLEILAGSARRATAVEDAENPEHLIVYTLRDISARKRIETAEREAKEAALAADAAKTQLISNMSHELKTPLNGIIGFADILKSEALGPLGASEYQEYSEMISVSGRRLFDLVTDMLTIAKLQASEYELDAGAIPVGEVIECAIEDARLSEAAAERSISFAVERGLSPVEIDASAFGDMLKRLLANALEYTDDNGLIRVRAKSDGADLVITVVDNGCGVDPQLLPKLKGMFYQEDASLSRQHEGAGLGLFIVSELASLHGGSLKLRSKPGLGFLVELRFSGLAQGTAAKAAA